MVWDDDEQTRLMARNSNMPKEQDPLRNVCRSHATLGRSRGSSLQAALLCCWLMFGLGCTPTSLRTLPHNGQVTPPIVSLLCDPTAIQDSDTTGWLHDDRVENDARCLDMSLDKDDQFIYTVDRRRDACVGLLVRWWRANRAPDFAEVVPVDPDRRSPYGEFIGLAPLQCDPTQTLVHLYSIHSDPRWSLHGNFQFFRTPRGTDTAVTSMQCGNQQIRRHWYVDYRECRQALARGR